MNKRTYLNLFLLALFVRFFYNVFLHRFPILSIPLLDAENYANWAWRILHESFIGNSIFFAEPLYAYLLAFFMFISPHGAGIMIALQTILGALLSVVVALLGKRLFNRSIGLCAGIVTAIYGPFIFYENLLLKTSMETFFLALFVLCCLAVFNSRKKQHYLALGAFLGLLVILKGNVLVAVPLVVFMILRYTIWPKKLRLLLAGLFCTGCILVILPVTIRNYYVGHDFVLTNYSVGMFVYQGNWWDADGALLQPPFSRPVPKYEEGDFYKMAESYAGKNLKPSQVSSFWMKKAVEEIVDDPSRWLKLFKNKMLLVINRVELADNYDYVLYQQFIPILRFLPNFWPVASLGLVGFILLVFSADVRNSLRISNLTKNKNRPDARSLNQNRDRKLVLGLLAIYVLFMLSGSLSARYRQPIIPFLIILSMVTVWYIWEKIRESDWNSITVVTVLSGIFFYATSVHLSNFDFINNANFYNLVGSYYLERGNEERAYEAIQEGLALDPEFPWLYSHLYIIYMQRGQVALAKEALDHQITIRPDDPSTYERLKLFNEIKDKPIPFIQNRMKKEAEKDDPGERDQYFYEAMRYTKKGDRNKAEKLLKESLMKRKRPKNTLVMLASLKKQNGDIKEAQKLLEEVIHRDKYYLAAYYNLANIHLQKKEFGHAAKLLRHIVDLVPDYGDAWYYLGTSLIADKQLEAALPVVQGYTVKYEKDPVKKDKAAYFKSLLNKEPQE